MSSSLEMLSGLQALDQFGGCLSRLCPLLIILCFLLVPNILQVDIIQGNTVNI